MAKRVAMLFGIVFLLVGILGLISSGGMAMGDASNPSMLLGYFPINLLHNVVHILFGVWGLVAMRSSAGAILYCKVGGVIYIVLAICGFVIPTTFGFIPIGGYDIGLHALLGVVLAGVGFTAKEEAPAAAAA